MSFKFPSAADSKNISELKILHTEICAIQSAILDAREAGLRTITICDTPIATSIDHWNAFRAFQGLCGTGGLNNDEKFLLSLQDQVIACFVNLGYSIKRITNPATGNTLCWEINW